MKNADPYKEIHAEDLKVLIQHRAHLSDLLALIHRDGGNYEEEHGVTKAFHDAMAKFHEDRMERLERMGDAVVRWLGTLTITACCAAFLAAYVADYLAGK